VLACNQGRREGGLAGASSTPATAHSVAQPRRNHMTQPRLWRWRWWIQVLVWCWGSPSLCDVRVGGSRAGVALGLSVVVFAVASSVMVFVLG